MSFLTVILAVLSIWEYPARYPEHERLCREFAEAMREHDYVTMEEMCTKGVALLPDDPVWRYNLACSQAYFQDKRKVALETLEKAIDLGYRDVEALKKDDDLKPLAKEPRFAELLEYAHNMRTKPILFGPSACVAATGTFGSSISLGEQNLSWDFDAGCFQAYLNLTVATNGPHIGELYVNRDGGHSSIDVSRYPGLTRVGFDRIGRERRLDRMMPNTLYPYPVFGNCSMAIVSGRYWRSIPRLMMTRDAMHLKTQVKFYLTNQLWVLPTNLDTAPVGTNGDLFASIAPYWLVTAGRSWSDLPYLEAALMASGSLKPKTKAALICSCMMAPTLMTLIRKSLVGMRTEADYLTERAHPTAMPPGGLNLARLKTFAMNLEPSQISPLVPIGVDVQPPKVRAAWPELTYATPFAWAFVLRSPDEQRTFTIRARGAAEYAFRQTHGARRAAQLEPIGADAVRVTLSRSALSVTNRVDIMVCGRANNGLWGAPSYVSFAVVDPKAPYSDPVLTPLEQPATK